MGAMSDVNKAITALRPKFQPIARAIIDIANDHVFPLRFPGFEVRITETLRDDARQAQVLSEGASDVKRGWHNVGLAFDFAVVDDKGNYVADGSHPAYDAVGGIANAFGCRWPIVRKDGSRDAGHIEYHPGFTFAQLEAAIGSSGDVTAYAGFQV